MTDALAHALALVHTHVGGAEASLLADAVWLAAARTQHALSQPAPPGEKAPGASDTTPSPQAEATEEPESAPAGNPAPVSAPRPDGGTPIRGIPLSLERPPSLPEALAHGRALLPFRKPWPRGLRTRLDIQATVDDYSRSGRLLPVFTPAPERWFETVLIVDTSLSMTLWHDLIRGLGRVMEDLGAFRAVRTWSLTWQNETPRIHDHKGHSIPLQRAAQHSNSPSGRRLILVITDCAAPGWRQDVPWQMLRSWGRSAPLALVNPLPRRLWHRSALNHPPCQVSAPRPTAPNAALRPVGHTATVQLGQRQALPTMTLTPHSLRTWAETVMGAAPDGCAAVLLPGKNPPPRSPLDDDLPDPASMADAFVRTAPPAAVRLAVLGSALDSFTVPMLRVLRERAVPGTRLSDLAEVLSSGLLVASREPGREPVLAFATDARNRLYQELTRRDVRLVHRTMSAHLADHLYAPHGMQAILHADDSTEELPGDLRPFAEAAAAALRMLGINAPSDAAALTPPPPPASTPASEVASGEGPETGTGRQASDDRPSARTDQGRQERLRGRQENVRPKPTPLVSERPDPVETHRPVALDDLGVAHRALHDLVMAATVRIHRAGPEHSPDTSDTFLGSGFFIAPNWVLTCAHVVRRREENEVAVVYEERPGLTTSTVTGEVAVVLPDRSGLPVHGPWPPPDLALVRLREPVAHDCVYVSERPGAYYGDGVVYYSGWVDVGGELRRLSGTCAVQGTSGGWSSGAQIRLGDNELPSGVSGGPVVDPVRGEVFGVLRSSRTNRGLGSTCTGVEQLRSLPVPAGETAAEQHDLYQAVFRAHDRYHSDRQRDMSARNTWVDVQNQLGARTGRTLRPEERIQLLGRLAALPPPASTRTLLELVESLLGGRPASRHPAPRSWRDGLGALYGAVRQDEVLDLALDYAVRAMSSERPLGTPDAQAAEQALWEWVQQKADGSTPRHRHRLGQLRIQWLQARRTATSLRAHDAPSETRWFVLLELQQRGWEPDRGDWRVSVVGPTGEPALLYDGERAPLGELPGVLAAPLTEAFRQCDEPGRPAVLQVRLPDFLHGLDIDAWRLGPGEPPLGVGRPVVMGSPVQGELHNPDDLMDGQDDPVSQRRRAPAGEDPDALDDGEPR